MAGSYRFLFYDLLANAALTELPMVQVNFSHKLNDVGAFTGSLVLSAATTYLFPWANTPPGRTALYVDRGGRIVWAGIVVTRTYTQGAGAGQAQSLTIGAAEMFWYFLRKRVITADAVFTNVDQLTVVESLLNTAQAAPSGNIGVAVPSTTSGILRTQTWHAYERKLVGVAIKDLSVLDQGFDWRLDVDYGVGGQAAGIPGKQFVLGYPRIGQPFSSSGWVFEHPGNIEDYTWPEDASAQAVTAYMQGSGSGSSMILSSATNTALLMAGYPQLDEVFVAKDQTDPSVVAARAVAAVKAYSSPVVLPQILVDPDQDPKFGSYALGDDCLVRITSPQFPALGQQSVYRLTVLGDKPSGFWRLDDTHGTAADVSGNLLNGTVSGGVTVAQPGALTDGDFAMAFDGLTGAITGSTSNLLDPGLGSLSVEGWVKLGTSGGSPASSWLCVHKGGGSVGSAGWGFGEGNNTSAFGWRFSDGTHAVIANYTLPVGYRPQDLVGRWAHVVVIFDRTTNTFRVYVNGVRQSTEPSIAAVTGSVGGAGQLGIGTGAGGWLQLGGLDDVAIYQSVLTDQQVANHFQTALSGNPFIGTQPGYQGYWRIVAIDVQPQDQGIREQVILTLGAPPV